MPFVSVPGAPVRFCVWETRVQDFATFVEATGHDTGDAMFVAGTNGWQPCPGRHWRNPGFPQTPRHPVVGVNWRDARAFCQWLTDHERRQDRIGDRAVYRLPTDVEWSAAVGLTNETGANPQARFLGVPGVFPWGTNWPPAALAGNLGPELGVDPFDRTAPVGSFAPNPLGIFDLAGNVAEWCEDSWNDEKPFRVLRSAPWNNDCRLCLMSSYRFVNLPEVRLDFYGFRVVLGTADGRRSGTAKTRRRNHRVVAALHEPA
jgi:formylglycine-generating enzyme required for sulfatase activity